MLTFKIRKPSSHGVLTKKTFLSIISSVYDSLGLVAPVVFLMKSLFQDIWTYEKRIGWGDPIPARHWKLSLFAFQVLLSYLRTKSALFTWNCPSIVVVILRCRLLILFYSGHAFVYHVVDHLSLPYYSVTYTATLTGRIVGVPSYVYVGSFFLLFRKLRVVIGITQSVDEHV